MTCDLTSRPPWWNDRAISFDDCIAWTRLNFEVDYNNKIRQLLHNFPEDQVTTLQGPPTRDTTHRLSLFRS